MEIGLALANDVPIMTSTPPSDLTLRQYVRTVSGEIEAVAEAVRAGRTQSDSPRLLLDPEAATDHAHRRIEQVKDLLVTASSHYAETLPELQTALDDVRAFGQPSGGRAERRG